VKSIVRWRLAAKGIAFSSRIASTAAMKRFSLIALVAACNAHHQDSPKCTGKCDVQQPDLDGPIDPFAAPLGPTDFTGALDKPFIRGLQPWLDDAAFEIKWQDLLSAPIALLGGTGTAYYADLARLAVVLPGGEVICHGDPKFDNFGWQIVDGAGLFGDNDFDDSDYCPVAADALRNLLATDLWFSDPGLDDAALQAYVATVLDPSAAVTVDPTTQPVWSDVRTKGLTKDTSNDKIVLGGEVQVATVGEIAAVTALFTQEPRLGAMTVLDVTRDVHSMGGSAGMRRFWALVDSGGTRSILELKEENAPATQAGTHNQTVDVAMRMELLKPYWWGSPDPGDHFDVDLLGARFLVRDRMIRASLKPSKLTPDQIRNVVQSEASQLALRHRAAWPQVTADQLTSWLRGSSAALVSRWRAAYTASGGH
jgi:hypothetical protein